MIENDKNMIEKGLKKKQKKKQKKKNKNKKKKNKTKWFLAKKAKMI